MHVLGSAENERDRDLHSLECRRVEQTLPGLVVRNRAADDLESQLLACLFRLRLHIFVELLLPHERDVQYE